LCDLYIIRKKLKKRIKGLTVCLKGDLKYGRTVHSLIYALARLGAEVFLWPQARELDMPEGVLRKLRSEYNYVPTKVSPDDLKHIMGEVEVLYIAPVKPYTLPLWREPGASSSIEITIKEVLGKTDVIYVTRVQTERTGKTGDTEAEESGPAVTRKLIGEFKRKPLVMHPLPRMNELPSELDAYPRSVYFQQAAYGVPVRMALTALLLGASEITAPEERDSFTDKTIYDAYKDVFAVECPNPNCISKHEREKRYAPPKFNRLKGKPLTLRCAYCDQEVPAPYIASSEWHQGILENRRYHSSDSLMLERIKPENLIIFDSESEAQAHGFKPSHYASVHHQPTDKKGKASKQ
jgi:hypothetical protein